MLHMNSSLKSNLVSFFKCMIHTLKSRNLPMYVMDEFQGGKILEGKYLSSDVAACWISRESRPGIT